jgi:DNA-binding CsgD family transcriptional regulator/sugar-specific transcriptional regulator TrmB
VLEALGISPFEEQVYRAVLRRGEVSPAELTTALDATTRVLGRALSRLQALGLVRRMGAGRYAPASPEAAIERLIFLQRAGLAQAHAAVAELVADFRRGNLQAHPSGLIETVVGAGAIRARLSELEQLTRSSIMTFDRPPYTSQVTEYDEVGVERPLLERGVEFRAIYDTAALELPGRLAAITALVRLGERARTLPTVPVKLRVFDDQVGVIMLVGSMVETEAAAIIHRSSLLDALIALFEAYWPLARTIVPDSHDPGADELTEQEAAVARLLGAGLTDQAIARQLGISSRTARRRIAMLMERLHATTRFEAGAAAVRRGWL